MTVGSTWKAKMEPMEPVGRPERAKENLGAGIGGGEHGFDHAAGPLMRLLARSEAQHAEGEDQLQSQSPGDRAPADAFAVG